jgi:hypothetical protein
MAAVAELAATRSPAAGPLAPNELRRAPAKPSGTCATTFNPVLKTTVDVPHPNMLRLSRDNLRLYVTNSLLTPWDNDPDFGPARNNDYGIWWFAVDRRSGGLTPSNPDGRAWVSFTNVRKKTTTGPAGPHLVHFDPSIPLAPGEH